jgi:hypothetical protein
MPDLISYFEKVHSVTKHKDGLVALNKLTREEAGRYVDAGIAWPVRGKDGAIRRLIRIPRERSFVSVGACVEFMNSQASTTARSHTEAHRLLPFVWRHKSPRADPTGAAEREQRRKTR